MEFKNKIFLEKVTISHSVSEGNQKRIELSEKILKDIFNRQPKITTKRNNAFKVARGKKIGTLLTFRHQRAVQELSNFLKLRKGLIFQHQVTLNSLSFGIPNHLVFPNQAFDPQVGIIGFYVTATFSKPGIGTYRRGRARHFSKPASLNCTVPEILGFLEDHFCLQIRPIGG